MFPLFYKQCCTDRCNTRVHPVCLWKQPSRKIKTNIFSSLKISSESTVLHVSLSHALFLLHCSGTNGLSNQLITLITLQGEIKGVSFWEDWELFSRLPYHWKNTCSSGPWFLKPGVWRWPCCNHYMLHHGQKVQMRKIVAIAKSNFFFPISTC